MPTYKKKTASATVNELVSQPASSAPKPVIGQSVAPSFASQPAPINPANNNFRGMVDNRVIPDAGLPTEEVSGVLDTTLEGHGLLRPEFAPSDKDIYISASQIRRFRLRPGDLVNGLARRPKANEKYWGLLKVIGVDNQPIEQMADRPAFDRLTPIYPNERIVLETDQATLSTRVIDLVAPIGKGQRGLIVSPPKAGKTTILKEIAHGIAINHPKMIIMAVLVGERPEEVTDISRSIKGEVIASNFDEPATRQTKMAELALERARRLVEQGNDVIILLDSVTRLARAYNLAIPTSGRTLSGGFDPAALYPPKHFFGAARNVEKGGSLTIVGTALIETGSRMDELIYEEFKGTGNMELHLERALEQRRIFPAISIQKSGTRQENLLYDEKDYKQVVLMRRMIDVLGKNERTELFLDRLSKTKTNKEFLKSLKAG
ncbi:transcription termination factor Rho [Patescibacteria group bacterium]|nr:transcription termination factor Rho [Patescibacteria group bacterium]MBU1931845.1 transcription termination factor Rho [Patescibacteria group bacterium]